MDESSLPWFPKQPLSRTIFVIKNVLMWTGLYKFIEAFYLQFVTPEIEFSTFIWQSVTVMAIVLAIAVIAILICSHLFRRYQSYYVTD